MRSMEAEARQLGWSLVAAKGLTNLAISEGLWFGCHGAG